VPAGALGVPGAAGAGDVPVSPGVLGAVAPGAVVVRPVVERLAAPEEEAGPGEDAGPGEPDGVGDGGCELCSGACSCVVVRAGRPVVRAGVVTAVSVPAVEVGVGDGGATKVHST
jgi:hypothetical protein